MVKEQWQVIRHTSWREWLSVAAIYIAYHALRGTVRERCRELHVTIEAAKQIELAALRTKEREG